MTSKKRDSLRFEGKLIARRAGPVPGEKKYKKEDLPAKTLPIPEWLMETPEFVMDTTELVVDTMNPPITVFRVMHRKYRAELGKFRSLALACKSMLEEQQSMDEILAGEEDAIN